LANVGLNAVVSTQECFPQPRAGYLPMMADV
jgi:hypothetical protein